MNKDHVKGAFKEAKGKVKEEVGHATGSNKMESEGILERVKGKFYRGFGDLKDSVKRTVDNFLEDKEPRKRAS